MRLVLPCTVAVVLGAACTNYAAAPPAPAPEPAPFCTPRSGSELVLRRVTGGLDRTVGLAAPAGDDRLFAVEQIGRIRVIVGGELLPEPYLDLTDHVVAVGHEQGLLGLAFHPDFASNGRFVVHYTAEPHGDNVISELVADPRSNVAYPGEREILRVDRQVNPDIHNGGAVAFGPDGYLYVSIGDGSVIYPADLFGTGQNVDSLLAKVLRLDLESGTPYAIPPDNPWFEGGGAPEVYAWGLRNPWRISIDPLTGDLYIGDVGQDRFEEINLVPAGHGGLNFGWSAYEGPECFGVLKEDEGSESCNDGIEITPPLVAIDRRVEDACAVIGGHVYRGGCMPDLWGHYVFGDYCTGVVRTILVTDGEATEGRTYELDGLLAGQLTSFGVDGYGEIYIATIAGRIYHLGLAP